MPPASPDLPSAPLQALHRSQRRLLLGGGGLITLLVLLTTAVSIFAGVGEFHDRERQKFFEARGAIDYFLVQRDRAYAGSVNANDVMWSGQREELRRLGQPMVANYLSQGMRTVVRAEGPASVPWLVLGDPERSMPQPELEAYLGMIYQYSLYTTAAISSMQGNSPAMVYGYDPQARLMALPGVVDEAQLLRGLRADSRAQAFALLKGIERHAPLQSPDPGPMESAAKGHRLASLFGRNPLDGRPSLVGILTLAEGTTPYFRRVTFEPISSIGSRLEATAAGSYLLTGPTGEVVLAKGPLSREANALGPLLAQQDTLNVTRLSFQHLFAVSGGLSGTDWRFTRLYDWSALWRDQGMAIVARLLTALSIIAALWLLLWRVERKVMAPALAEASRVYESEALSQTIIGTAPVGLALLSCDDGAPLLQNQVARELATQPAGDSTTPALYAALVQQAHALPGARKEFNWTLHDAGAAPIQLQVALAIARYRDQTVWVCALRDVTAQMELQQTLERARRDSEDARAAAEAANRAKSAFVATMSHEIRTPLNGILGHLELLARSPLQPAQQERLQRIRLSADSLMAIISDVLDFSKIEAGQLDIDPAHFNVRELIEQATLLYAPEAHKKGVKLFYMIDAELEDAYRADAHRIRQIINNLLSNAVKFTESGRITLHAGLGNCLQPNQSVLRLRVVDSGIGMSDEQLAHLFRPFEQGDASVSRRYGGSGLGLALCRQLAHLLGGSIQAESTLGVGTVFTLEVPVHPVDAPQGADQPLSGTTVTLLSAAPEWRQEIGQVLQRWGAGLTVLDRPAALPTDAATTTLLIFGERRAWPEEDEQALCSLHARLVRAYPSGPLAPERRPDGVHVTSYSSPALLRALLQDAMGADAPSPVAAQARPPAGRGRVLLVEDNPVNRELIQQQLEELGWHVGTAEDGQAALSLWPSDSWDVVLTDINMPVMDGYELAQTLRARGEKVPILAITATALASERERCRQAGIDGLLLKPLDLERLSAALDRYVPASNHRAPAPTAGQGLPLKLRALFVESGARDLDVLAAALREGQQAALLDKVHSLKGVLLMMGERPLGERFGAVEHRLREHDTVDEAELQALLASLSALIDSYREGLPDGS